MYFIEYFIEYIYILLFEILLFFLCCTIFLGTIFLYKTFYIVKDDMKELLKKPTNKNYIPQTGDILLIQWENTKILKLFKYAKHYPTHVCFVWNRKKDINIKSCIIEEQDKDGTYLIEINHFRKEKNLYLHNKEKKGGLRIIRYETLTKDLNGIVYVRKISKELHSNFIEETLNSIGSLGFDPNVSYMGLFSTVGVGWRPVYPQFSNFCNFQLKFHKKNYSDEKHLKFFCSEFLIWFLFKLHCIKSIKNFYEYSPGCFLSKYKKLENINIKNNYSWSEEEIIIRTF